MKHLQSFSLFEARKTSGLTTDQEEFLNECSIGTWSVNPTTGLVDVKGDFTCSFKSLTSLPGISFGHVSGNFFCNSNQLTSLAGAPQTVRDFYCGENQLTSLEGAPQTVNGNFWCHRNQLTSLAGAPQTVGGDFNCFYNYNLKSLEGAPQTVGGNFDCSPNDLKSLEGAPQTVGGGFRCDEFRLDPGKWNMQGWVEVLNTGSEEAKKLILTLPWLQPDWWNLELQRDPGKTVHLLSTMWNHMPKDMQSAIKIPKGYEDDFELFSGFDELGLF